MSDERYERGLATLRALHGPDGPRVLLDLGAVAPDLARFAIEGIGDLYRDATLDPKTRELATVAALTALGTAPSQLRGHIAGALDVGATRAEIVAVITQMYAYAGFPDLHYTIEDMVLGDDKVAVRTTLRGTNTGELFGAAPTGRRVEVRQMGVFA